MTPEDWIEVRASGIHGDGAFARKAIRAGQMIGNYAGERYSAEDVGNRDWDLEVTYVFGLSDGSVIDGSSGGNVMRHLNHSCEPNCAALEVWDGAGQLQIVVRALRAIAKEEELFLDYALNVDEPVAELFACHCGHVRCRGTMLAISVEA